MKPLVKKFVLAAFAVFTLHATASAQTNLALNQPVTSDLSQAGNDNFKGNDGSGTTRWAAADGTFPKLWRVDLGTSQTISQVESIGSIQSIARINTLSRPRPTT